MNKKILSLTLLLFSVILLIAQPAAVNQTDQNGKKQGKWVKKDKYGRIMYEGNFKDGRPVGEFKYYYDNKDIKTISVFSKNGTMCMTKHYFPDNVLMAEGKYVNQKRDSIWKFYNAPNALVSEESFKLGKKHGVEKNFNGKGKLVEERNWKDSLLHGAWKKYYKTGGLQQEGIYVNGKLEGEMKFFYPGGVVAASGNYLHSLKNGKWVQYHKSGKFITQLENYVNGKLEGAFAEWSDKNAAPQIRGSYKQGKKHDKWTYHNKNGKLEKDTTFFIGYLHGPSHTYYLDGTKKSESHFHYGNKTGKWTEWDEQGKVLKEESFDSIETIKAKMTKEEKERRLKKKKNE